MKILIAYAGKTGGTAQMCRLLKEHLPAFDVEVADLAKTTPDPSCFDYVVFGGAVRMAKLPRAARLYQKANEAALSLVPHTVFLLCAFADQFENYAERVFSKRVLESADELVYFGGELDLSKQKGIDKLLVRMMRNSVLESEDNDATLPGLLPEHVRLLADTLRAKLLG